jgi:zinc transport system substrate-binding protein
LPFLLPLPFLLMSYGATIPVIEDWLKGLGAKAVLLQPPGTEPHDAALNVPIVRAAAQCGRVFAIGLGLEPFVHTLERALGRRCPPIERLGEVIHPSPPDPHLWFDPAFVRLCIARIRERLAQDSPERKGYYEANFQVASRRLQAFEHRIFSLSKRLKGRYYIAEHDAFRLLTARLGLKPLGSIQPGHEQPPSATRVIALIRRARKVPLACVLGTEEGRLSRTVAEKLRVPYLQLDTLERAEPKRDYFERFEGILNRFGKVK